MDFARFRRPRLSKTMFLHRGLSDDLHYLAWYRPLSEMGLAWGLWADPVQSSWVEWGAL